MRLLCAVALICLPFISCRAQTECPTAAAWSFDEINGNTVLEKIGETDFLVHNNYNRPELASGVKGSALRLDGFSTWVEGNYIFPVLRSFSVSVWYATEAYPTATAALINQQAGGKGFGLELDRFGILTFVIHAGGMSQRISLDRALPKYQWNLITAAVDIDLDIIRMTLNDTDTKEILATMNSLDWADVPLKLGVHNQTEIFATLWPTGVLNGLMDEVTVCECLLKPEHVDTLYSNNLPLVRPDLSIPETRHAEDVHRPRYHAMPPTSWTNEPYGLIFHDNYHHLFYQKNPNGPYHAHMHWGHLRSRDLVRWEDQPIALAPEPGWDQHGIWSGHVIKDDAGKIHAFYTGVDGVKAGIGVAYPDNELSSWTKNLENALIKTPPPTYNHMDFRDPFIWKHEGKWYMIIGSGIHNVGGILMTYTSDDLIEWEVSTPLYYDNFENSGRFWEMPAFFQLDGKWVLLVNTVPWEGAPAETIYWVGNWTGGKFQPDHSQPKKFDIINGAFLAPSISEDAEGRITAIGIIPEARSSQSQNTSGWAHTYSLPRVLRMLTDGNLGHIPHPNLCRLRGVEIESITDKEIVQASVNNLPGTIGDDLEIKMKVVVNAEKFSIALRKSADGSEHTDIVFDEINNKILLDRTHSSASIEAVRDVKESAYIFSKGDTLDLRLFIDKSVVEVFVDEVSSFSTRIYPILATSIHYDMTVDNGTIRLIGMQAWKLDTVSSSTAVCEPEKLREQFRPEVVTAIHDEDSEKYFSVFPNPAKTKINVSHRDPIESVRLMDLKGSEIFTLHQDIKTEAEIRVEYIPAGMYLIRIKAKNKNFYKKIIIQH